MKVLLRRNIPKLGKIGELVEVKPGYARNFLLPQRLAVQPTQANLRAVEREKQRYLEELARMRGQLEAKAQLLAGKEITIRARANEEGLLYGSIGPAQIAAALAEQNLFVDQGTVELDSAIRKLDKYAVAIRFADDIRAEITLWVVPLREESAEPPAAQTPAEQTEKT
jgi:large subunit ribosomal protein L9